jgi:hypothetical protein
MPAVLLALLIAPPPPDESAQIVQHLAVQLREATQHMADDPEKALRLLNALLDDPRARELEGRSPAIRTYREQALYLRAQVQLRQGRAQAVADDMTALLERKRA